MSIRLLRQSKSELEQTIVKTAKFMRQHYDYQSLYELLREEHFKAQMIYKQRTGDFYRWERLK
jgi:hypothetical protein